MDDLMILKSGGGWYLGTLTIEGYPNSRDSIYFPSKEEATKVLEGLKAGIKFFLFDTKHKEILAAAEDEEQLVAEKAATDLGNDTIIISIFEFLR